VIYHRIGNIRRQRGEQAEALRLFRRALRAAQQYQRGDDLLSDIAFCHLSIGETLIALGRPSEAAPELSAAADALRRLKVLEPNDPQWQATVIGLEKANARLALAQREERAIGPTGGTPHPSADANRAAQLNIDYQQALARWKALPVWKRFRIKRPDRPSGI
jgi:tetratricopeptide (TPR) repeat protein